MYICFIHLFIYASIYLFTYLLTYLSMCFFISLFSYLSIYMHIYTHTCIYIHPYLHVHIQTQIQYNLQLYTQYIVIYLWLYIQLYIYIPSNLYSMYIVCIQHIIYIYRYIDIDWQALLPIQKNRVNPSKRPSFAERWTHLQHGSNQNCWERMKTAGFNDEKKVVL